MIGLTARRATLRLHRWIGLAAAVFWLVQALSGVAIVFHWELEDASVPGAHRTTDLDAIGRRLSLLAAPGSGRRIVSVWTTAGLPDRYDITVADAKTGVREAVRVSGAGEVLRTRDKRVLGPLGMLVSLHQTLLAGLLGSWIVEISGLLLLTNLTLGLFAAWPHAHGWRRARLPPRAAALTPQLFGWHRALGFWIATPMIVLASAGTLLVFEDSLRAALGGQPAELAALPPTGAPTPFAAAVRTAEAAFPGSSLTMVKMPTATDATYRVRVLAPGEIRRAYGVSTVFVDANTGRVRATVRAGSGPLGRQFVDLLYAVHTGEAEGLAGRLLSLTVGVGLTAMVVLGVWLWARRRR